MPIMWLRMAILEAVDIRTPIYRREAWRARAIFLFEGGGPTAMSLGSASEYAKTRTQCKTMRFRFRKIRLIAPRNQKDIPSQRSSFCSCASLYKEIRARTRDGQMLSQGSSVIAISFFGDGLHAENLAATKLNRDRSRTFSCGDEVRERDKELLRDR